jgi:hypothetical protein
MGTVPILDFRGLRVEYTCAACFHGRWSLVSTGASISAADWEGRRRWLTPIDESDYPVEHLIYTYLPEHWDRRCVHGTVHWYFEKMTIAMALGPARLSLRMATTASYTVQ